MTSLKDAWEIPLPAVDWTWDKKRAGGGYEFGRRIQGTDELYDIVGEVTPRERNDGDGFRKNWTWQTWRGAHERGEARELAEAQHQVETITLPHRSRAMVTEGLGVGKRAYQAFFHFLRISGVAAQEWDELSANVQHAWAYVALVIAAHASRTEGD